MTLPLALALALAPAAGTAGMTQQPPVAPEGCDPRIVARGLPCPKPAWQLVGREHEDRVARLMRQARGRVDFKFSQEEIAPAEHGVADFPVAVPVLRVTARQDAFFDSGSDVIRPEAYELLDVIARNLKQEVSDVAVFVVGHTDSDGEADANVELGLRRAQAVASALVRRGIYQAAIYRISFGEAMPIADNATAAGRARNRRVEFLFSARVQAITRFIEKQPVPACTEAFLDEFGKCRKMIRFDAVKVMVAPEHRSRVIELEKRYEAISLDASLSKVEIEHRKQAIEIERARVPIDLSVQKVPIDLTGQ